MPEIQAIDETGLMPEISLARLSHGGCYGCKIAPALMRETRGSKKSRGQRI